MSDNPLLTPASLADLEQALAHALQFDGRKQFIVSGEMMARITAAHLVECLRKGGFVVMKQLEPPLHSFKSGCEPDGGSGGRR